MSFSGQLTDLYHLLKNSNGSLDHVYTKEFETYLRSLTVEKFVDSVFVYGIELRDELLGSIDSEVLALISLINTIYEDTFKDPIESSNKLQTIYNIGTINMYLYFCEREKLTTSALYDNKELISYVEKTEPNLLNSDNITENLDINRSVDYLRRATKLASETLDISKGIYFYHVIRIFEYIFSIFENYKVDNDNKPIDLDSFYVFSDQLEDVSLWNELARQIKIKHNY